MSDSSSAVLSNVDADLYDPRTPLVDPYPYYHALRERDPVFWHEPTKTWLVTGYEEGRAVMRDDEHFGQRFALREVSRNGEQVREQPYFQMITKMMFMMDGADHKRVRPLFSRWFMGPERLRKMTPMVERAVDAVLDNLQNQTEFDLVKQFAYPIPLTVISELLGVSEEYSATIAHDVHDFVSVIESVQKAPDVKARADAALLRLRDFFADVVKERRKNLGDDLLSAMIIDFDDGKYVDETELLANILLMYIAGHETTTDSFSLCLYSLFRNRDEMERLRADPTLIRSGVEELLRYDSTAQGFSRSPYADAMVGDKLVKEGTFVLLLQGAINRDPKIFPDPDRLDLSRGSTSGLSFGGGAHVCVGNMLARLELQVGLNQLLKRLPKLELDTINPPADDFKKSLTRGLVRMKAYNV
ncbi:cytochrome P450 [Novosphingobium sp. 9U]|uniref:cytochrome P450 n=1 Tax=Novosphingobium sp. 9U TaxID=2653158 RepID=UPI0012F39666|nr:cytochrome P450 [Novosphingobium sp. 9U]VWX50604.1 putative Cytochrome P450 107B1 [Novosphingobium sp. 9U]